MSLKIKIILGFLIVVAGFLVFRVGTVLKNNLNTANLSASGVLKNIFGGQDDIKKDSDKDGIVDVEEAFFQTDPFNPDSDNDGFLDGEEIAEGCSPVIARPNDCLVNKKVAKTNLTNTVSDLVAGGLYTGDLKNPAENANFSKNLGKIKAQVYLDFQDNFSSNISVVDLKISNDNDSEAVEKYLDRTASILNNSILRSEQEQINEIKSALNLYIVSPNVKNPIFSQLNELYTSTTKSLLTIDVPSNWKDLHLRLVNSTDRFSIIYKYIQDPVADPVATVLSFEKLVDEFYKTQSILDDYKQRANKL
jgi:hypothetical protein